MEMFFTPEQVALRLQLKTTTIREWLKAGKIPRAQKMGARWRIPESAIAEIGTAPTKGANDWTRAGNMAAPIYEKSLAQNGELTAITTAPGGYEPAGRNE